QQVPGRRHRQIFGEALDDAENDGLDDVQHDACGSGCFESRLTPPGTCPDRRTDVHCAGSERGLVAHTYRQGHGKRLIPHSSRRPDATTLRISIRLSPDCSAPGAMAGRLLAKLMLTLFHHGLCPHSRFVRLALGEYGLAHRLVEERPW